MATKLLSELNEASLVQMQVWVRNLPSLGCDIVHGCVIISPTREYLDRVHGSELSTNLSGLAVTQLGWICIMHGTIWTRYGSV